MASLSGVEVLPDRAKIEPLALVAEAKGVPAAQEKVVGASERSFAGLPVFFHLQSGDGDFPRKVGALGGRTKRVHPSLYTGEIPGDTLRYLSNWPEVVYIEAGKRVYPMLDLSRPAVFADDVHSGTGLPAAYTGAGTYVGFVDSGLSASHLDFFVDGNSSQPRVAYWYPSKSSAGIDTEWHGTHIAGIAAGNGFRSGGLFTGMAPGARLLVAKTIFTTVDIQERVSDLLSFAGTTPTAINLSLALNVGPHDGTSGFESAIGFLATDNVASGSRHIIAVAAGNERTNGEHFQTVLPPFGSVNVPLTLENGGFQPQIDLWADGTDRYTVTATMGTESASAASGRFASSSGGRVEIFNRTDAPPNGATHISVFFTPSATTPANIRLVRTRNGGSGKIDAYMEINSGSFSAATEAGTVTEPANAEGVLAVGSFNTKSATSGNSVPQNISSFSSLGPTRDGRIKPDLAAPGSVLYSTKSGDPYLDPHPEPQTVSGHPEYIILQGTSMAAPHVAGTAALVWESNPLLTSAQMRERLKQTATPVSPSPNTTWGFGKANTLAAVSSSVASITAPKTAFPGSPVALTSENSSGPFGVPITTYQWAAPGALVSPPGNSNPTFLADAPGEYSVSLTITAGGITSSPASNIIHVNHIPVSNIIGPSSDNVGLPVSFSGAGSTDPDGQALTYRWVLVSRPTNSTASLPANNIPNVTFTPDVGGTYEIGLRVDDGLDNSALATKSFTANDGASSSGGGGGGGCSIGNGKATTDGRFPVGTLLGLLMPLGLLALRRKRGPRHSFGIRNVADPSRR